MLANTLKTAAVAALLGLGVASGSGTAASAYTIQSRCDDEGCVRLQCDNFGDDCVRIGYTEHDDYDRPYSYTRTYTYYPPRYDGENGYFDGYGVFHPYSYNYNDYDDYPG